MENMFIVGLTAAVGNVLSMLIKYYHANVVRKAIANKEKIPLSYTISTNLESFCGLVLFVCSVWIFFSFTSWIFNIVAAIVAVFSISLAIKRSKQKTGTGMTPEEEKNYIFTNKVFVGITKMSFGAFLMIAAPYIAHFMYQWLIVSK